MKILGFGSGVGSLTTGKPLTVTASTTASKRAPYVEESVISRVLGEADAIVVDITEPMYYGYFSFYVNHDTYYWQNNNWLKLVDSNGNTWFKARSDTAERAFFNFWNGEYWVDVPKVVPTYIWGRTARFDISYQPNGIKVYLDHELYAEYQGHIPKPHTPLERLIFTSGGYNDYNTYFSAVFVADEDTRPITMCQHLINGEIADPNYQQFVGSYLDVNSYGVWGTGSISTDKLDQDHLFTATTSTTEFDSGYEIVAIGISAKASSDQSGVVKGVSGLALAGNMLAEFDAKYVDALPSPRSLVSYEHPTGRKWLMSDIATTYFGVRSRDGTAGVSDPKDITEVPVIYQDITIINNGAEEGTTGWTTTYGNLTTRTSNPSPYQGSRYFMGGSVSWTEAHQDINLLDYVEAADLDVTDMTYVKVGAYFNSYSNSDKGAIHVHFYDEAMAQVGLWTTPYVAPSSWINQEVSGNVPVGARTMRIRMIMDRNAGSNNDAYIDAIYARIGVNNTEE